MLQILVHWVLFSRWLFIFPMGKSTIEIIHPDFYLVVTGTWMDGKTFHSVGNVIIPTGELHHFSEGLKPPTRLLLTIINHIITININHILTVYYQPIVGWSHQPAGVQYMVNIQINQHIEAIDVCHNGGTIWIELELRNIVHRSLGRFNSNQFWGSILTKQ